MSDTTDEKAFEYVEDEVPLREIDVAVEEVLTLYGAEIIARSPSHVDFSLPRRRGVAASGHVKGTVRWAAEGEEEGLGTVTATTGEELMLARPQRVMLLVAGAVGAMLFLLWPYFPNSGALAWIGGIIALATYFLTLRKTQHGTIHSILQRVVDTQREKHS